MKENDEEMRRARETYTGTVTLCPPSKKPKRGEWKVWSKTVKQRAPDPRADAAWQHDDAADPKEERRRERMARARLERIAERNAALLERVSEQEKR